MQVSTGRPTRQCASPAPAPSPHSRHRVKLRGGLGYALDIGEQDEQHTGRDGVGVEVAKNLTHLLTSTPADGTIGNGATALWARDMRSGSR